MRKKRKIFMNKLINLRNEENKKSDHKLIYKIQIDREEMSKQRRVFSKIFKLDENNQYGFAMRKPLPIGIFKKKPSVTLELMNKTVKNCDLLKDKIGHIFVVDIEFVDFNDPVKKMYNEVYPCIFEPKTKIPAGFRSV